MKRSAITSAYCIYHDTPAVSQRFAKEHSIISKVKNLKGATWSQSRIFWYISQSDFKPNEDFDQLSSVAFLDYSALKNGKAIKSTEEKSDKMSQRPTPFESPFL